MDKTPQPTRTGWGKQMLAVLVALAVAMTAVLALAPAADASGPKVKVKLRVLLEGSLEANQNRMRTNLWDLGLIPVQDPNGSGAQLTINNPAPRRTPVDWVRVELRDASDPTIVAAEFSGIVQANGRIVRSDGGVPRVSIDRTADYHAVVFHKSHLPVASAPLTVDGNRLKHDFRNSSTGFFFGAHQIEPHNDGRWAMIAGNAVQDSPSDTRDINGADVAAWSVDNGNFGQYLSTDFNMDGDVNGADKIVQDGKNGLFASIPF